MAITNLAIIDVAGTAHQLAGYVEVISNAGAMPLPCLQRMHESGRLTSQDPSSAMQPPMLF